MGQTPWWAQHILAHSDEWYACALDDNEAHDERIFLMLFVHQTVQRVWFLECREQCQIVGRGAMVRGHDEDAPAAYRQFEFLQPLLLLSDLEVPFGDDTNISVYPGTVFMGASLVHHARASEFPSLREESPRCEAAKSEKKAKAYSA